MIPQFTPHPKHRVKFEYLENIFAHYCSGVMVPSFCGILFHNGDLSNHVTKKLQKYFSHTRLLPLTLLAQSTGNLYELRWTFETPVLRGTFHCKHVVKWLTFRWTSIYRTLPLIYPCRIFSEFAGHVWQVL